MAAAADLVTYSPEQVAKVETETGLLFSGYLATEGKVTLIPVFLRADRPADERKARIMALNKSR